MLPVPVMLPEMLNVLVEAWVASRLPVIVMGAEGHGLHDLVRKNCDMLLRIPMAGAIASLNVSVATGVVLFSWRAQSTMKP